VRWHDDALAGWVVGFKDNVAADLVNPAIAPAPAETLGERLPAEVSWQLSSRKCHRLVTNEVQPDGGRPGSVEVEGFDGLPDTVAKLIPGVSLGDDGFRQTLSDKATIGFLYDLEDQLTHTFAV